MMERVNSEECEDIRCSDVLDPVCGLATYEDGSREARPHHNLCHLLKTRCLLEPLVEVKTIKPEVCGIPKRTRRLADFTIVGAHDACNHTCPTHCVDTYEPACAQIWKTEDTFDFRPMINHCHIDLFSCAMGVNVTIHPLQNCYKNPSGLQFMTLVAGIKSLGLFTTPDEDALQKTRRSLRYNQLPKLKLLIDGLLRYERYIRKLQHIETAPQEWIIYWNNNDSQARPSPATALALQTSSSPIMLKALLLFYRTF